MKTKTFPLFKKNDISVQATGDHNNGTRYVKNEVALVAPSFDGNVHSGRSVALSSDGAIDVPINATLGSELITGTWTLNTGWVNNGDGTFTYDGASSGSGMYVLIDGRFPVNSNVVFEFELLTETSSVYTRIGSDTIGISEHASGSGVHTLECTNWNGNGAGLNFIPSTATTQVHIRPISIKEIQSTQGQISYYNVTTKRHESIDSLPLSTTYRLENLEFNNLVVLWDRSFTQADRDKMDANPELVVRWAKGEDVFSIGVIGVNDKVYVGSDTDAFLRSIQSTQIAISGTYTRNTNLNYGIQTLGLKLNSAGVPTSIADANTLSFVNNTSGYVDTQLTPSMDKYTIEWNGILSSGVTEQRVLTHDAAVGDNYYIDGILQGATPALPSPTESIKLSNTAPIGFADTVDTIYDPFKVWSTVEDVEVNTCNNTDICLGVGDAGDSQHYGYSDTYGTVNPPEFLGLKIKELQADTIDGVVYAKMGESGTEAVPNLPSMKWDVVGFGLAEFVWNATYNDYNTINASLATFIANGVGGNLGMNVDPDFVYDPITDSADWSRLGTGTSVIRVRESDGVVVAYGATSAEASVMYKNNSFDDGFIEATFLYRQTSNGVASFPMAIRMVSDSTFIGCRSYDTNIEVYERVDGAFNRLIAIPNPSTENYVVRVEVIGTELKMFVDGVLEATVTTAVNAIGGAGMIARGHSGGAIGMANGYSVGAFTEVYITDDAGTPLVDDSGTKIIV